VTQHIIINVVNSNDDDNSSNVATIFTQQDDIVCRDRKPPTFKATNDNDKYSL